MMDIDWKIVSDYLFEKSYELDRQVAKVPARDTTTLTMLGTSAVVLSTLAKAIQKGIAK